MDQFISMRHMNTDLNLLLVKLERSQELKLAKFNIQNFYQNLLFNHMDRVERYTDKENQLEEMNKICETKTEIDQDFLNDENNFLRLKRRQISCEDFKFLKKIEETFLSCEFSLLIPIEMM